jgi:hypothetical protein
MCFFMSGKPFDAELEAGDSGGHASATKGLSDMKTPSKTPRVIDPLRAVYTRVFCVRFSVRDGAAAQQLPLLFHVRDRARKAKEPVGRRHHRGRRNGRKKRECRRPLNRLFRA